ncbi:MAG: hypothetical protein OEM82_08385 [Acidobacteriota bacterium]|nr:hypothetical protein [Acidobacteriota bacterium]
MKTKKIILAFAMLVLSGTASARISFESLKFGGGAPEYEFESLGFNAGCGQVFCSFGRGINNRGDVVGWGGGGVFSVPEVGFMLEKNGNLTVIAYPGAPATRASGINEAGDIVGQYGPGGNANDHAFLRTRKGLYVNADFPGSTVSALWSINNRGQAVGNYTDEDGIHAYLRNRDGSVKSFDFPAGMAPPNTTILYTQFRGINDNGDIVGIYRVSGGEYPANEIHGFLLTRRHKRQAITPIDFPVGPRTDENLYITVPLGINNRGVITGGYLFFNAPPAPGIVQEHGFVRSQKGRYTTVDFPGAMVTEIYESTDDGVLVGGWVTFPAGGPPEANAFVATMD